MTEFLFLCELLHLFFLLNKTFLFIYFDLFYLCSLMPFKLKNCITGYTLRIHKNMYCI